MPQNGSIPPTLIILRGLPGSGKSSLAEIIGGTTCSADDYFLNEGKYVYVREKQGDAHVWCEAACESAMEKKDPLVVVDNVNYKRGHYQRYLDLAEKYDYRAQAVTVGETTVSAAKEYAARTTHEVPEEVIVRMAKSFEGGEQ